MKNLPKLQLTTRGDREIVMTKVFEGPRDVVFDALTRADLLKGWVAPRGATLPMCESDLRVGGPFRIVYRSPQGTETVVKGFYREIARPERLVAVHSFDPVWFPGEATLTTLLAEQDGRTTLSGTLRYDSREVRDTVFNRSEMQSGLAEAYDRLATLVAAAIPVGARP